jgi:polysaccharide lyase-like protein
VRRALIIVLSTSLALLVWAWSREELPAAAGAGSAMLRDEARPAGRASPIWRADYERGDLSHWPVNFCVASYSCTVSTDPPAPQGRYSARYEVRPGDPKTANGCRAQSSRGVDYRSGEYWFRVTTRFPQGYRSSRAYWQIIHQWHESRSDGAVDLATFIGAGLRPNLSGESAGRFYRYWRGPSLATGVWHDFVYRIKMARNPSRGFAQVWLNGKRQRMVGGGYRAHGATTSQGLWYPVVGLYQKSTSETRCAGTPGHTLYIDNFRIGRTPKAIGFNP